MRSSLVEMRKIFFLSSQWLSYLFHFPRVFSLFCLSLSPILVYSGIFIFVSLQTRSNLFYNVHFSRVSLLPPLNNENVFLKHPLTTVTLSVSRVRSNVAKNIRIFFFFFFFFYKIFSPTFVVDWNVTIANARINSSCRAKPPRVAQFRTIITVDQTPVALSRENHLTRPFGHAGVLRPM